MDDTAICNALLTAREERQALLEQHRAGKGCLVMLSLNLPGAQKSGERAERLFAWGMLQLAQTVPLVVAVRERDALGPFALLEASLAALQMKELAIGVEGSAPAGRLLDVDVYDGSGRAVGRSELGIPPRPCLICTEDAVVCMRLKRHDLTELQEKVNAIINTV